jgi:DNA-directed RNA polymerase subunit omega
VIDMSNPNKDINKNTPNRFELVILAAKRCRQINNGSPITIRKENDKNSVIALKEVMQQTVNIEDLRYDVIKSFSVSPTFFISSAKNNDQDNDEDNSFENEEIEQDETDESTTDTENDIDSDKK